MPLGRPTESGKYAVSVGGAELEVIHDHRKVHDPWYERCHGRVPIYARWTTPHSTRMRPAMKLSSKYAQAPFRTQPDLGAGTLVRLELDKGRR